MRNLFYIFFIPLFLVGCKANKVKKQNTESYDIQAGRYYNYYGKKDSAFYFFNRVATLSKDSLEKYEAYFGLGRIQLDTGDFYAAQSNFLASVKTIESNDSVYANELAASYNALANATLELKDYQKAIDYYHLASQYVKVDDYKLYVLNNLGVVYQKQGDYQKSAAVFDSAAQNHTLDTSIKAKIISNYARTKWLADPSYNPVSEYMYALMLRKLIREPMTINASFSYLSDYYEKVNRDSALYYARERLNITNTLDDQTEKRDALIQLMDIAPDREIREFIKEYIHLNDSIYNARTSDRNQYAVFRYDAEKTKADNLVLQKHIGNQRFVIWVTILAGILVAVVILAAARIRQIRFKQQAERKLKETKLKTSQKVHDVVANGLYYVMNELEHRETIDKEILLNKIEGLYEKSRDISYEDDTTSDNDEYRQQVHQLLSAFAKRDLKVLIVGNEAAFWNKTSNDQKRELRLVLEEMMVNMRKHSGAGNVVIQFEQESNTGYISYKDDGKGFPTGGQFGNGLNNTVNRIKSINGEINFEKSGDRGASISISFPLEHP